MSPIRLDTGVGALGKPVIQAGIFIPNSTFAYDTDQNGTPDGWIRTALFDSDLCYCRLPDATYGAYALGNQHSLLVYIPAGLTWIVARSILSPPSWGTLPPVIKNGWKISLNYTWWVHCDIGVADLTIVIEVVAHNAAHTKEVVEITRTIHENSSSVAYIHETIEGQILYADWTTNDFDHIHLRIDVQKNTGTGVTYFYIDNFSVGVDPFDPTNYYEYEFPVEPTVEDGISFPTMRYASFDRLPSGLSRLIDESGGVRKNRVVLPFRAVSQAMHDMLYKFWNINAGLTDVGIGWFQIGPWWPLIIRPNLPRYPFPFYCNWIDKEFPFSKHEGSWISTVAPIYNGTMVLEEI